MKQKITQAQAFTSTSPIKVEDVFQSASNDILSRNSTVANMLSDGTISQSEYDQETNTPAIIAKASEVESKLNKYNELQANYDVIDAQVEKDFP